MIVEPMWWTRRPGTAVENWQKKKKLILKGEPEGEKRKREQTKDQGVNEVPGNTVEWNQPRFGLVHEQRNI